MKKLISLILAAAVIFTLSTAAFAAPADVISKEEARLIALEDAGLSENDVRFTKTKLEFDDGIYEYEIEFKVGYEKEYEYTVNAENGRILEKDFDFEKDFRRPAPSLIRWFRNILNGLFGKA